MKYDTVHRRLRRMNGSASRHACVGCGGTAKDWSYDGGCPDEHVQEHGEHSGRVYCLHSEHYSPRCRRCHLTHDAGTASTREKLTSVLVLEIRSRYARGDVSLRSLAGEYGVTNTAIRMIVTGRTWKHLPVLPHPAGRSHRHRLSPGVAEEILAERLALGTSQRVLAEKYGVSQATVSRILSRLDV